MWARNNRLSGPTGRGMSGISEIQTRIQAIQHRVQAPPLPGRFQAVLSSHIAETAPSVALDGAPPADEPMEAGHFVVTPQGQSNTVGGMTMSSAQGMTLGMMLGISGAPMIAPRSATVVRSAELTDYLRINGIEFRNYGQAVGIIDHLERLAPYIDFKYGFWNMLHSDEVSNCGMRVRVC